MSKDLRNYAECIREEEDCSTCMFFKGCVGITINKLIEKIENLEERLEEIEKNLCQKEW